MLLTAACAKEPRDIDWDLTERPTKEDIGWDSRHDDVYMINPVGAMTLTLPGGTAITHVDGVGRASIVAGDGETIEVVSVTFEKQSTEDAYTLLTALAPLLGVAQNMIDDWYDRRSIAKDEDISDHFSAGGDLPGVSPSLETRLSFDDKVPVLVGFEIYWPDD